MRKRPSYEREYDIEGSQEKIFLQIFDPEPREAGWGCEYRLAAPHLGSENKLRLQPGDDKMDAFVSALVAITIQLRSLSRRAGSSVSFMGDENLDLIDRDFY